MNKAIDRTWVDFYKELAERLLDFREKRNELIIKIRKVYELAGIKLPTLEKDNKLTDIDPFTIFGLFNKSSLKESNKIKILDAVSRVFNVESKVPSSFESIPTINNMRATYYDFEGYRNENDIDDLWTLFSVALTYANEKTFEYKNQFIKYFDLVMSKRGIGNSKLTSGLYWISPETYANIDSCSKRYIIVSEKVPFEITNLMDMRNEKITAEEYLTIIYNLKTYLSSTKTSMSDFIDFSYEAWCYSEQVNKKKTEEIETTDADKDVETVNYWTFSPRPDAKYWGFFYDNSLLSIGLNELGDFSTYTEKKQIKQKLQEIKGSNNNYNNSTNAIWQFTNEMKIGDIVYVKKGQSKLIGWGIVSSRHNYNINLEFSNSRQIDWKQKGEWITPIKPSNKILTKITPYSESVRKLNMLFETEKFDTVINSDISFPKYNSNQFLKEVFMNEENYHRLVQLIKIKKNVILQGPPGVGKTFAAKRLAYSIIGEKAKSRVKMIQFHQSYSYEDFIMGFRPTETG